jgi:myosin heavy subunit
MIEDVFSKSENELIKILFEEKLENKSLFTHFKNQLDELFEIFRQSNNKYIKCIKTKNKEVKEKHFDRALVMEQMNYGGILEAIKIKKQGYSIRKSKEEFFEEFNMLFPEIKERVFNDEIINKMVKAVKEFNDKQNPCKGSNFDLIKIGKKNYIFMREDLKRFLDIIKNKHLMINNISNLIIRKKKLMAFVQFKNYVNYVKIIKMRHYIIIDWLKKKKKYENLKKQSAIKIESYFRRYLSIKKYKIKKKRKDTAIKIECNYRAYISRKKYKKLKEERKEKERKEKERKEREKKDKKDNKPAMGGARMGGGKMGGNFAKMLADKLKMAPPGGMKKGAGVKRDSISKPPVIEKNVDVTKLLEEQPFQGRKDKKKPTRKVFVIEDDDE